MRITVIGGGVAGSACATALAYTGAEVRMYEAYEDPAGPVGSYVSLAVNGLRALDALGCLGEVRAAGFPVERQRMWSGRGKLLGDVARGRRPADPMRSVTLKRADLVEVLRQAALANGVKIETGTRLDPAEADGDLVVGADGIWSATRTLLDPSAPRPAYAGLYTISGEAHHDGALPAGFNWIFARRGVFMALVAEDGRLWWTAQVAAQPPSEPVELAQLREMFATEPAAAAVLAGADRIESATLLHTLKPVPCWQDGRRVLVGDAAHPVGAGQGAAMAIEDAVVLARCLESGGTVADFDHTRRGRTGKLARIESRSRDAKVAGPLTSRIREIAMPLVFTRFYERATAWLYDFEVNTDPS